MEYQMDHNWPKGISWFHIILSMILTYINIYWHLFTRYHRSVIIIGNVWKSHSIRKIVHCHPLYHSNYEITIQYWIKWTITICFFYDKTFNIFQAFYTTRWIRGIWGMICWVISPCSRTGRIWIHRASIVLVFKFNPMLLIFVDIFCVSSYETSKFLGSIKMFSNYQNNQKTLKTYV